MSCLGATRRHRRHIMSSIGCIRCGYLGPSNDTPEVLVEIRAAEIAERGGPFNMHHDTQYDVRDDVGWERHYENRDPDPKHEAGWLAREIWSTP